MTLYPDKKAFQISSLPILFLIATLAIFPNDNDGRILYFTAFVICYYPLLAILACFKRLKKNSLLYETQYIEHAYLIGLLPFVVYLGCLLFPINFTDLWIIFLVMGLYSTILHFLCLTKRLKWRWLLLCYLMLWALLWTTIMNWNDVMPVIS